MVYDIIVAAIITIIAVVLGLTVHPVLFLLLAFLGVVAWHALTGRHRHSHRV